MTTENPKDTPPQSQSVTPPVNFPGQANLFTAFLASITQQSEKLQTLQQEYYRQHIELWSRFFEQPANDAPSQAPLITPDKNDKRFQAPEWNLPFFDYMKQAYLLNTRWANALVELAELSEDDKRKLRFLTKQVTDAASPSNFAATNPEVIKRAAETGGESLLRGMENLNADLKKGRISTTDESAFEVGRNLATTQGSVVYENALFQLIQYAPLTEKVFEKPLLIVPPCINKYYILDLQPDNSFVRYAIEQGHTVFLMSWRNVPEDMGNTTWDDYLESITRALDVATEIAGISEINTLGFCIGGTLLASALAALKAKNDAMPALSMTLLTTLLDFSDVGELGMFVNEESVAQREAQFKDGGILNGKELAQAFSWLRPNDLVWNYIVNNYLKGDKPAAFDLLYWNGDSTNLPGAMYTYYLRNTYLENNLRVPNKLTMLGEAIDLRTLKMPAYVLATREDHIVPWQTAYESARLLDRDEITFVLGASGHVAGVINPPAKNKRSYYTNVDLPNTADAWLAHAEQQSGSWWPHWAKWLATHSGKQVKARKVGNKKYPAIEDAPGRYVKERIKETN